MLLPHNQAPILTCPPESLDAQRKLRIAVYIPPPGARKVLCDLCCAMVWLGPNQQAVKAQQPDAPIVCFTCATPHLRPGNIRAAGVKGGTYITTDGHSFENDEAGN